MSGIAIVALVALIVSALAWDDVLRRSDEDPR